MEIGILRIISFIMKNFVEQMGFGIKIETKNIISNLFKQQVHHHQILTTASPMLTKKPMPTLKKPILIAKKPILTAKKMKPTKKLMLTAMKQILRKKDQMIIDFL